MSRERTGAQEDPKRRTEGEPTETRPRAQRAAEAGGQTTEPAKNRKSRQWARTADEEGGGQGRREAARVRIKQAQERQSDHKAENAESKPAHPARQKDHFPGSRMQT